MDALNEVRAIHQLASLATGLEHPPGLPDATLTGWERGDFDGVHFALAEGTKRDHSKIDGDSS